MKRKEVAVLKAKESVAYEDALNEILRNIPHMLRWLVDYPGRDRYLAIQSARLIGEMLGTLTQLKDNIPEDLRIVKPEVPIDASQE